MKVSVVVEIAVQQGQQNYNPLDFSVSDQDGYSYTWHGGCGFKDELGGGTLAAGRRVKGSVDFEVPATTQQLTLDYKGGFLGGDTGSWLVAVTATPTGPTPPPAGVTVDLTFSGPHLNSHVTGFYPQTIGTYCTWGSSPSDKTVKFVEDVWLNGGDIGVPTLDMFNFEDLDGAGTLDGSLNITVADGFNTFDYAWDPGLAFPQLSKGTATYQNNYTTVVLNVQAWDIRSGGSLYTGVKGTMTCSP